MQNALSSMSLRGRTMDVCTAFVEKLPPDPFVQFDNDKWRQERDTSDDEDVMERHDAEVEEGVQRAGQGEYLHTDSDRETDIKRRTETTNARPQGLVVATAIERTRPLHDHKSVKCDRPGVLEPVGGKIRGVDEQREDCHGDSGRDDTGQEKFAK